MFLNITFESNTDIQNQANLYKFQDTIKTLLKEWNDNWYLYDEINRDVIFQNNQCERLTVTLNSDFQTFNILFEFDKYKNSQINALYQNLNVNEFGHNSYNNVKFLGTKIMELQIMAYDKSLQLINNKNKKLNCKL